MVDGIGESVLAEDSSELTNRQHRGEFSDPVISPGGCLAHDGGHLIDGQFPAAEDVDAHRQLVDTIRDGNDLVGVGGADPGPPAQVLLDGVDAGHLPAAGVGEQPGGDIDETTVLGVEVSGDLVEFVVESLVEVFVERQHGTHSTRIPTYVR